MAVVVVVVVTTTAITAIQLGHTECTIIIAKEEEIVLAGDYHLSTRLIAAQFTHVE